MKTASRILLSLKIRIVFFFVAAFLSVFFWSEHFFFWDNISQASAPANWYFENNFRSILVPDDIATGHPPFFPLYLALLWKIFGKSLLISHLAMVPFIFGIVYQADSYLTRTNSSTGVRMLILLVVLADTTLISQMSLITFDIVHIFFFLWCVNCLMDSRRLTLSFAFAGLCLISLRGSISASGIILFVLINDLLKEKKVSVKTLIPFLPGLLSLFIFLLLFYLTKGWVIHNTVSGRWDKSSEFANFSEMVRNTGIIIWRLIDYGRAGIWLVFPGLMIKAMIKRSLFDKFFRDTFLIAMTQMAVFLPILISYRNFIGHRYLLTVIIPVAVCTAYWILKYSRFPRLVYSFIILVLLSGHFWIYPVTVAQGWDSTTAHWPYYRLRNEMISKLDECAIPVSKVGSFFPNIFRMEDIDLRGGELKFKAADIEADSLILFSNIFNVPDQIISDLDNEGKWRKKFGYERRGVFLNLYERNPGGN